jgi:hypothetical protein
MAENPSDRLHGRRESPSEPDHPRLGHGRPPCGQSTARPDSGRPPLERPMAWGETPAPEATEAVALPPVCRGWDVRRHVLCGESR